MAKRRTKKKKRGIGTASKQQESIRLRTRIIMLIVLVAMGGLFLAGYALGPERRWDKLFSWFTAENTQDIQELWEQITQTEGCLVGQQDYSKEHIGEGSILNNVLSQQLIHGNRKHVGAFLVSRMDSQQETQIHTCPYLSSKEGELAIFFLQHLTHANWFEYNGEHPKLQEYIRIRQDVKTGRRVYDAAYTDQQLLWKIIAHTETLEELKQYYLRKLKDRE